MTGQNQIGGDKNNINSLEMYEWINYYKPKHLTVRSTKIYAIYAFAYIFSIVFAYRQKIFRIK